MGRSGILVPVEGGRWHVTINGRAGDLPPLEEAGWLAWAASVRSPTIAKLVADAVPLSPLFGFRRTANVRRQVLRGARAARGPVVLGDALCALNPLHGQGMSVAALSVRALVEGLAGLREQHDPQAGRPV